MDSPKILGYGRGDGAGWAGAIPYSPVILLKDTKQASRRGSNNRYLDLGTQYAEGALPVTILLCKSDEGHNVDAVARVNRSEWGSKNESPSRSG